MLSASAEEECAAIDIGCVVGEGIGNLATGVAEDFVRTLAEGTINILKVVNAFWLYLPTPDVASEAITTIQSSLVWYTYAFAVLGIMLATGKMLVAGDFKAGAPAVKMIINLILTTAFYTTVVALLLAAGDAFAPWIIERATGGELAMDGILSVTMFITPGVGPGMLLVILAFLGALANALFMLVRAVMITILVTFLPILAASSASEAGEQAWKKAQGYLLAFLLFKPVAAVILALGLLMIMDPPTITTLNDAGSTLFQVMVGIMTLVMVALALPTLIKFVVPVAAAGSSAAFSGGAIAAGGVAAGATVVAIGATGGAAAVAGAGRVASTAAPAVAGGGSQAASGGAAAMHTSRSGTSAGSGQSGSGGAVSSGAAGQSGSGSVSPPGGSGQPGASSSSTSDGASGATTSSGAAGQSGSGVRTARVADTVATGARNAQPSYSDREDES